MVKIHLMSMHCMLNEESDKDEVFLKHLGKRIWPTKGKYHAMASNERTPVDVHFEHDLEHDLSIELWDWDLLTPNDLIGTFQMHVNADDYGKFTTTLRIAHSTSTASYLLEWEIVED